jgi:catechol 2,3-dioxygenase-like lactoylglutathione lyase family enzyme
MLSDAPVCPILPVTDLEVADDFYTQKLGLKPYGDHQAIEGIRMYEAGKNTILTTYERPAVKVEHTQAGFMVGDLESVKVDLEGRGVKFEDYDLPGLKTTNGVAEMGGVKSAWFKDPFGNILVLNQQM